MAVLPEAARAIAQRILQEHVQRDEDDIIWAIAQVGEGHDGEVRDLIRNLVATSRNADVIRCALNLYPATDGETAWNDLNDLLDHPIQTLGWAVHERLARFEELEERLIERSDILLEDDPGTWLERKLVIWLSHRQNMDVWVRRILEELPYTNWVTSSNGFGPTARGLSDGQKEGCRRLWKVSKSVSSKPQSATWR